MVFSKNNYKTITYSFWRSHIEGKIFPSMTAKKHLYSILFILRELLISFVFYRNHNWNINNSIEKNYMPVELFTLFSERVGKKIALDLTKIIINRLINLKKLVIKSKISVINSRKNLKKRCYHPMEWVSKILLLFGWMKT